VVCALVYVTIHVRWSSLALSQACQRAICDQTRNLLIFMIHHPVSIGIPYGLSLFTHRAGTRSRASINWRVVEYRLVMDLINYIVIFSLFSVGFAVWAFIRGNSAYTLDAFFWTVAMLITVARTMVGV
jgi:hypothetical protein